MKMRFPSFFWAVFVCLVSSGLKLYSADEWKENFEGYESGKSVIDQSGWKSFEGFHGDAKPESKVVAVSGAPNNKALSITHTEAFRTDNWGLQYHLPESYRDGAVWIQCRYRPSKEWAGAFALDARGPERGAILARVSGSPFENKATKNTELRWHCTWSKPHWRLYTLSESDDSRWYKITLRLDLDSRTCAAWLDDQVLSEEAPLASGGDFSILHIGFGGLGQSPALIDDLTIGRPAPEGFSAPDLLPVPEKNLIFRFAGLGDPQIGFGGYDADKVRFGSAVKQINRAGSELSLILGDMVHENRNEEAYQDLVGLGKDLESPHYVRGNHEDLDLYLKYFSEKSNYSIVHQKIRFVVLDAVGNQAGLDEKMLAWIESEFSAASLADEEIVLALHVSPWQDNKKGAGKYNQIGPGRDRLRELMKEHKVLLCLSGHYHTGLWHGLEEETHYLVLGGTARVSGGTFGWCLFDVYPDRIVMHQKPVFFGYEKPGVTKVHALQDWIPYESLRKLYPYAQQGPLTIPRHRPVEE